MVGTAFVVLVVIWVIGNFVQDPGEFLNVLLIGVTNGSVYGLIALGYTLVYGILQLINFAHGDVFALSGLVASSMIITVFDLSTSDSAGVIVARDRRHARRRDALRVHPEHGNRVRRLPAAAQRARVAPLITAVGMSFHPPEHRPRLLGRQLHVRPAPRSQLGRVLDRRRRLPVEQARSRPDHAPGARSRSRTSSARRGRGRRCARPRRIRKRRR